MEIWQIVLVAVVGVVAGFINVVAGGGSLLTLPIMISILGFDPQVANGSNRIAIFSQNIFATYSFGKMKMLVLPYSIYLGISAFLGAIIGAKVANLLPDALFNTVLAIVMLIVVVYILFNPGKNNLHIEDLLTKKSQLIGIIIFFFIGIYGGFIQAGTGLLIMTALGLVNKFTLVKANAIKVVVALIYTVSALAIFLYEGNVNWLLGLNLAVGNSLGGYIASKWSVKKGDKWIRAFMLVSVTALAIKLLVIDSGWVKFGG